MYSDKCRNQVVQLIETVITSWTQMYSDKCRNQVVQLIETVITSWTQMYSDKCWNQAVRFIETVITSWTQMYSDKCRNQVVQLIETVITSWTQMYSDKCRNQVVQLIETVITSWTQMYSDKCRNQAVWFIETVITSWTQMYSDKCRNQAVRLIETVITSWTQMYSDKCRNQAVRFIETVITSWTQMDCELHSSYIGKYQMWKKINIPVWYVPPAFLILWGGLPTETETSWTETPLEGTWNQAARQWVTSYRDPPHLWTEWQTSVETLPYPKPRQNNVVVFDVRMLEHKMTSLINKLADLPSNCHKIARTFLQKSKRASNRIVNTNSILL